MCFEIVIERGSVRIDRDSVWRDREEYVKITRGSVRDDRKRGRDSVFRMIEMCL